MPQPILDQRGAVLLAQSGNIPASRQDCQVSVACHLSHGLEEQARLDRPEAVADDDRQRGVVFQDLSIDKPVTVVVINNLVVHRDVLRQKETLDDVGHYRGASYPIEDDPLELLGLDLQTQTVVQSA